MAFPLIALAQGAIKSFYLWNKIYELLIFYRKPESQKFLLQKSKSLLSQLYFDVFLNMRMYTISLKFKSLFYSKCRLALDGSSSDVKRWCGLRMLTKYIYTLDLKTDSLYL